jgi:hypothetical protein
MAPGSGRRGTRRGRYIAQGTYTPRSALTLTSEGGENETYLGADADQAPIRPILGAELVTGRDHAVGKGSPAPPESERPPPWN